jgi:cell wall assembly regulator SMI1
MNKPSSATRATVIDNPMFERDMSTKAVINRNHTEYSKRLAYKNASQKKEEELQTLKSEVQALKELVNSIIASR